MLIYEAYNKNNGKVYIGLTTLDLETRKSSHLRSAKSGSQMYFHKAIRKHGEGAFGIKACKLENGKCIGCGRTIEQIRLWSSYSHQQRQDIMESLNEKPRSD